MEKSLPEALKAVSYRAEASDPDAKQEDKPESVWQLPWGHRSTNLLLAQLHLCAAWRLATEIGYFMPNKGMIIGDIAAASEHLVRISYNGAERIRDLRHRVQTMRRTDIDPIWAETAEWLSRSISKELDRCRQLYAPGLRLYLGLDTSQAPLPGADLTLATDNQR